MVFIVVLAQTSPHPSGRERNSPRSSPSVHIHLIWLIMNWKVLLQRQGFAFPLLFSLVRLPCELEGETKGLGIDRDGKVMEKASREIASKWHFFWWGGVFLFICVNKEYWWLPSYSLALAAGTKPRSLGWQSGCLKHSMVGTENASGC